MKRAAVLITVLALLAMSCTEPSNNALENRGSEKQSLYPLVIDSLGMRKQYDQAKWVLYCLNCDDKCEFFKETGIKDTLTFGMLDLKFERYRKRADTVDLEFNFYYHDTLKCDERVCRTHSLTGLAYKVGAADYFALINVRWGDYVWKSSYSRSRLYKPLQPEVIAYIKANRAQLNPWFRGEAKRRGIIQ